MIELQQFDRAVGMFDAAFDRLRRRHLRQPDQTEAVVFADAIVVLRIAKGQREQPLLLQIGLVDAREAAGNHCSTAEQSRRKGGMLAAAALAIVPVADDDPFDFSRAIISGYFRNRETGLTTNNIFCLTDLSSERIRRTREHVVAELVQMPTIRKPAARRRNMIGGGLAPGLDEDRHAGKVAAVPRGPRLHQLDSLAAG